jgi:maltose O-acetyltransferase
MRVMIEDDVVIGEGAILLPGAHVKTGARIPAGAVVPRRGRPVYYPPPSFAGSRGPIGIASRRAKQVVQVTRAWQVFGRAALGNLVFVGRGVRVTNSGTLMLGDRVAFAEGILKTEVVCQPGATLEIGSGCHFGDGTSLDSALSIRIGARCLFSSRVRVCDRDDRGTRRIDIGDDVWLAHGVLVHPDITIGDRSVGAGSVVTQDVPDDHLALGNPARSIPLSTMTHLY